MKKFMTDIKTLAALFIAGSAFTACSSDDDFAEQPENPAQKTYTLTINASKGDDAQSRALSLDGSTLNATWATSENVYVYKTDDMTLFEGSLQPQTAGESTTLKGELTGTTVSENTGLTLRFPRAIRDYSGQIGTLENIAAKYDYAEGTTRVSRIEGTTIELVDNLPVVFANQQAIVKFTLIDKASGNAINPTKLTIAGKASDQEDGFEVNKVESTSTVIYGDIVITPSGSTNVIYAALRQRNPGGNTITLTAETASGDIYTYTTPSVVSFQNASTSKYSYNEITVKMVGPCVSGKFSVSSSKQVYFSKGNLQATTSDLGATWTWAFAEHQWDKIGGKDQSGSGTPTGNNYIKGDGTLSENGTVDLFGWSTSATHLGIHNSTNNSDYSGDFVDWGSASEVTATIGTGWRTLTQSEWYYLLSPKNTHRTTSSGMQYIKAQVNGVNGLIVFPDDWSNSYHPLNSEYVNNNAISFENIKINESTWVSDFEAHGAVFLPVAGQRHVNNNYVEYPNGRGHYWTSTPYDAGTAYRVYFTGSSDQWSYGVSSSRRFGYAVRLVRDVK